MFNTAEIYIRYLIPAADIFTYIGQEFLVLAAEKVQPKNIALTVPRIFY